MRLFNYYRKFSRAFYRGPEWIDIPDYITKAKYKSPTAFILAWAYAFYMRFITIPGQMILVSGLVVGFYSMILVQNPLIIVSFMIFSIYVIDLFFGLLWRPSLEITREIPRRARAGTPFKIEYQIKNRRKMACWDLSIDSLKLRRGLSHFSPPASIEYLAPGEKKQLSSYFISKKRGRHLIASPIAESSFPFGLIKWSCSSMQPQQILIYPGFEPLMSIELPSGVKFQKQSFSMVSKIGESMDFLGCREFRTGDNPKFIHWRSTAKKGTLIVREFREECLSRIALIVDTYSPELNLLTKITGKHRKYSECFEAAVSLAAAVADITAKQDFVVDIFAAGPEIYHFQGGRSLAHLDDILDILAGISSTSGKPLTTLEPSVMEEITGIGTAVLILLKWDDERRNFINRLNENGVSTKIIMISGSEIPADAGNVILLSPRDIMDGKIRNI